MAASLSFETGGAGGGLHGSYPLPVSLERPVRIRPNGCPAPILATTNVWLSSAADQNTDRDAHGPVNAMGTRGGFMYRPWKTPFAHRSGEAIFIQQFEALLE
jgi:hypothetical protein